MQKHRSGFYPIAQCCIRMARTCFFVLWVSVLVCAPHSGRSQGAQGKYGFDAGICYPTFHEGYVTPTIKGYYLARLSHTLYLGGEVSFLRFSLQDNVNPAASSVAFGDIISVRQLSSYLFLTPKFQVGIGFRKHVFADFSMGPGFYLGGVQWSHLYEPYWTTPSGGTFGKDTLSYNTTYNLPNLVFRFSCGLTERIPTFRYWNIVLTESFGYIPGKLGKESPAIRSNYIAFTVGVLHKYPSVAVEED